ncbi:MAG: hypothetical protein A3F95_02355 [Candidatus Nealsonbacteria bacterium RIFCSPLOWO2_12_FULL_39_31]|uniref:Uncharacterized protein n=3 Tax=Candidatus Nealsoniibacteriota TaxID=1817911 RepID=A0A1G2EM66_9BACT|nr:MAG: hypothetical protein A2626_00860 [Candidatus Nealsonbacteria bacterium RIFCSPHIGHO2_01_FULL_38_55]OGZ22437.1 MAG: hypothetical protein A2981_00630 [Candidatus Nealsonbacteria bacterium RIFCSPLOWO2_01_FULL_38_120]OGZ25403.1 MAG: hypothetical protein A3I85_01605 [Candidatus Nealsonbacteria bacterium RIFCSPLOWO2_02_FULL_38_63]OGZ26471.1 MAG: hypothetical protein A3F95_02355 [Candidatus Nealsonbacteria bacterium RIFCSPLOWO2_12_FULL_39_31]
MFALYPKKDKSVNNVRNSYKLIITNFMQTIQRSQILFVGVDVHKDTHTAVGLSPFGEKIFEIKIGNDGCRLCINIGDQFARSVYYGRYKIIPIRTEIIKFCETIGFDYMGAIIWQKATFSL